MHQWNLSYERQLASDWLVSATYIGNKSTHIWTGEDVNPGVYIPGTCAGAPCSTTGNTNQRRVLSLINPVAGTLISDIYQADDGANAEYNGLLLKAEHRFSNHYSILANYAWAHCISEADFEGDLGGPQTQNPFNRNGERGNCGFDLRGTFNLRNWTYAGSGGGVNSFTSVTVQDPDRGSVVHGFGISGPSGLGSPVLYTSSNLNGSRTA